MFLQFGILVPVVVRERFSLLSFSSLARGGEGGASSCCDVGEHQNGSVGISPHVVQVTKYVEREILNHRVLMHPHIVQFKEVRHASIALSSRNCMF